MNDQVVSQPETAQERRERHDFMLLSELVHQLGLPSSKGGCRAIAGGATTSLRGDLQRTAWMPSVQPTLRSLATNLGHLAYSRKLSFMQQDWHIVFVQVALALQDDAPETPHG